MDRPQDSVPSGRSEVPRSLPQEVLAPTYQNRLRSLGRDLDLDQFRSIVVLEVDGGFIVRAVRRRERDIDLLQFEDDTFPERLIRATESRGQGERKVSRTEIAPTGYEDLLRAVGRWLDHNQAANIILAETPATLVVRADRRTSGTNPDPIEATLNLTAIQHLLDESFRLRSQALRDE